MERAGRVAADVAAGAQDTGRALASTAVEQSARVTGEAKGEMQRVVVDARDEIRRQLDTQQARVRDGLEQFRDQVEALADGRADEAEQLRGYLDSGARELDRLIGTIDRRGLQGLWRDAESFARRRPGAFLLGAGLSGFLIGRALRAGRQAAAAPEAEHEPRRDGVRDPVTALPGQIDDPVTGYRSVGDAEGRRSA